MEPLRLFVVDFVRIFAARERCWAATALLAEVPAQHASFRVPGFSECFLILPLLYPLQDNVLPLINLLSLYHTPINI